MKCVAGQPLYPETTAIDITHGQQVECPNDGIVACSICARLYCLDHSPQPCPECGRLFCDECAYDHRADITAHDGGPAVQH